MASSYEKIALWTAKICLFIVPFIPLYIAPQLFFPYITGKAFVFRTLVEVAFAAWVFLAIFFEKYRPKKSALLWAVGIFMAVFALSTAFGVNPARSFWSNFERMEGFVAHIHFFMYFLALAHVFSRKDWTIFLNLFVIAGMLQGVYTLFQKLGYLASPQGGLRADGTIGNPTYVAAYLIFVFAFALFLWRRVTAAFARYAYLGAAAFALTAIYFTASRGPTLALLIGGIVAAALYLALMRPSTPKAFTYRRTAGIALAILLALPVALWLLKDTAFVRNSPVLVRFASLSFGERTVTSRLTIWSMSFEGFKERPVLGWGIENYPVLFAKYYRPEMWNQEPWFDRSHNIIFDWLIHAGVLGLLAYLGMFVAASYVMWKHYLLLRAKAANGNPAMRQESESAMESAILFSILLFVYVLQNFFVFDNITTYLSFFAVLAYIHSVATADNTAVAADERQPAPRVAGPSVAAYGAVAGGVLAIFVALAVYVVNGRPLAVNLHLLAALKAQSENNAMAAAEAYQKAYGYNLTLGRVELTEQFTRFALAAGSLNRLDAQFRSDILRKAIEETQRSIDENPGDARSVIFLGIILGRVGMYDQAIATLETAIAMSPNKQQIYYELTDVYLLKGDTANAVKTMERIYTIYPVFDSSGRNLVAAYIMHGQQDKADALLLERFGTVDVAEELFSRTYLAVKNYRRLLGVRKAFVEGDPKNVQYRIDLANVQAVVGERDAAVRTLTEAIQLNPAIKDRAEAAISDIRAGKVPQL